MHAYNGLTVSASIYNTDPPLDGSVSVSQFGEGALARLELLQFLDRKCGSEYSVESVKNTEIVRAVKAKMMTSASPSTNDISSPPRKGRSSVGGGADCFTLKTVNDFDTTAAATTAASAATAATDFTSTKRRDDISHFTLRLAFSQQDRERQDWLIRQECRLLIVRLTILRESLAAQRVALDGFTEMDEDDGFVALQEFLAQQNIAYPIIDCRTSVAAVSSTAPHSTTSTGSIPEPCSTLLRERIQQSVNSAGTTRFALKVPFWPDAVTFVRRRRCFLSGGYAYVPFQDVEELIVARLRRILIESFALLKTQETKLQRVVMDPRLSGIFRALKRDVSSMSAAREISAPCQRLSPDNTANLTKRSFPPCMRRLSETLKDTGHLKYAGRLQLWLFFKACGMTMEEQLSYWKSFWDEPDKFDKQHKYNIRHAYGLEGKRVSYNSYPCSKVINGMPIPSAGEVHGCPFKLYDRQPLADLLSSYGAKSGPQLQKTLELAETHHSELACVEFFKLTHPGSAADDVGNAPLAYYRESCGYWERSQGETKENTHSGANAS